MSVEKRERDLRAASCSFCKAEAPLIARETHGLENNMGTVHVPCTYNPALLPIVAAAYADGERAMREKAAQVCDALIRDDNGNGSDGHSLYARLAWTAPRIRALPVEEATHNFDSTGADQSNESDIFASCEFGRRSGEPGAPSEAEDMFFYHGYSGPCPKPPLPKVEPEPKLYTEADLRRTREEAEEKEQGRWQDRIYQLLRKIVPDVDGSGCESGDALDVTITEINCIIGHLENVSDELRAEQQTVREEATVAAAGAQRAADAHQLLFTDHPQLATKIRTAPLVTSDEGKNWMREHDAGVRLAVFQFVWGKDFGDAYNGGILNAAGREWLLREISKRSTGTPAGTP